MSPPGIIENSSALWSYTYKDTHASDWALVVCFSLETEKGRVKMPRARGDQGMAPTPNSYIEALICLKEPTQRTTSLEGGEHLPFLLAIYEVVVVLHGDERSQLVVDSVVYNATTVRITEVAGARGRNILCMAWTAYMVTVSGIVQPCTLNVKGRTLPGVARAHANIPDVSSLDNIVQSLHCLLDWGCRVKSVACNLV
jgi:hypothetical protein